MKLELLSKLLHKLLLLLLCFIPLQSTAQQSARWIPFQARLFDSSGKAIPDGARLVQFRIFGEPTRGIPLWSGETHRVTVNGGMINVQLGTKNPLPIDRSDDPSRSFFDAMLYLQVTVDGDANGVINDADVPMLPRQAILPIGFAVESATSRMSADSQKLAGYDWSAILANGANNPVLAKLDGAKLAPKSVTSNHIAAGSILSDGLADGSVSIQKFAPIVIGSPASVGGLAVSSSTHLEVIISTSFIVVTNLEITIETIGRPVEVSLMNGPDTTDIDDRSYISVSNGNPNVQATGSLRLVRGETPIQAIRLGVNDAVSNNSLILYPPGCIRIIDFPGRGRHTYRMEAKVASGSQMIFERIRLVAREW